MLKPDTLICICEVNGEQTLWRVPEDRFRSVFQKSLRQSDAAPYDARHRGLSPIDLMALGPIPRPYRDGHAHIQLEAGGSPAPSNDALEPRHGGQDIPGPQNCLANDQYASEAKR